MAKAGAITLTRAQFQKTSAAKRGSYEDYLHYLAVHRAAHAAATTAPRAAAPPPLFDPGLAATPNIGGLARSYVNAQINPVLAQTQKQFDARAKAGSSAVAGATGTLLDAFKQYAPAAKANYQQAEGAQAATDTALADRLTGVGSTVGGDLAAQLAAINAPAATQDTVAGGATRTATGAANAGFASGSASLANLIAQGASAQNYGAQMPGFAALSGLQAQRNLGAQIEQDRAKAVGDLRSQIPGMVASELQALQGNETSKASARQSAGENARSLAFQKYVADMGFQTDQAKVKAAAASDAAGASRPDSSLSATFGYVVDANGRPILDGSGNLIPTAKTTSDEKKAAADAKKAAAKAAADAKKTGGLTPAQLRAQTAKANSTALSIIQKAAKRPAAPKGSTAGGPFGGTPAPAAKVPLVGSEAYYRAVHQAEAAIEPLVPDWPPQKVTAFVQRLANQYFRKAPPSTSKDPAVNPRAAGPPLPPGFKH